MFALNLLLQCTVTTRRLYSETLTKSSVQFVKHSPCPAPDTEPGSTSKKRSGRVCERHLYALAPDPLSPGGVSLDVLFGAR